MPAPARVAPPWQPASTTVTAAPRRLRWYAAPAPTMPLPITTTRIITMIAAGVTWADDRMAHLPRGIPRHGLLRA
ncbi:hypothetical protein GCM10023334_019590 [Nonomuraea thailandensis]